MPQKCLGKVKKSRIRIEGPATSSLKFASSKSKHHLWPSRIYQNKNLVSQAKTRIRLLSLLKLFFEKIPVTMEVEEALRSGVVNEENEKYLVALYNSLADFLRADLRNPRLILYLPFEILPPKNLLTKNEKLRKASTRFFYVYRQCWEDMLEVYDVRANFIDGNIFEPELINADQEMICKAVHLIPRLMRKGYVTLDQALNLFMYTDRPILKNTLAKILPIFRDLFLISKSDCERLLKTTDIRNIESVKKQEYEDVPNPKLWLTDLPSKIKDSNDKIRMRAALDKSRGRPPARIAWEQKQMEEELINEYSCTLSRMIKSRSILSSETSETLVTESEPLVWFVIVRGIGMAAESIGQDNKKEGSKIGERFRVTLRMALSKNAKGIRDEIVGILSRWQKIGIMDETLPEYLGIYLPKNDCLLRIGEETILEVGCYVPLIEAISSHPKISKYVYPAMIFFGSRIKGYAKSDADLDAGIFIKPNTPIKMRLKIQNTLAQILKGIRLATNINGRTAEFWLKNGLSIREIGIEDVEIADRSWAHLLFAGIWLGEEKALKKFFSKLLPGFLKSKGKMIENREARDIWLGEMEREALQYRLLHKGYWYLNPKQGGVNFPSGAGIDQNSAFWDSGYRRLATLLFIKKVFLPQI